MLSGLVSHRNILSQLFPPANTALAFTSVLIPIYISVLIPVHISSPITVYISSPTHWRPPNTHDGWMHE